MKNKIVSAIKTSAGELKLSEDALCKHTIFIGSTGSGKTTSLNVLLRDIIGYNAEDEKRKVGLLVFDLKGDNTFFKIRKWAKECGREDDVIDYCADSKFYFDPLGGLDSFRKIPEYVEQLYNIFPFQSSEVYWEQSLRKRFKTVLTYCLFRHGKITFKLFLEEVREFITADSSNSNWRDVMDSVEMVLRALEKKSKGISIESYEVLRELLEDTRASVNEWQRLDPRTKSNELSTMSNLISSFGNPITNGHIFEGNNKTRLEVGKLVCSGKIVVASFDGQSASAICKLLKSDVYGSIQARQNPSRLAGIVMDEFPLVATDGENISGDGFNMQTIRLKRGFVIAATQGLVGLDLSIGEQARRRLVTNFNNVFVFKSNEREVLELVDDLNFCEPTKGKIGFGSDSQSCNRHEPITLANAPTGYAAIKLADGFQSNGLVEIERLYVDAPPMPESKRESEIDKCVKVLRVDKCVKVLRVHLKAIDFNACLNGNFLDKDTL